MSLRKVVKIFAYSAGGLMVLAGIGAAGVYGVTQHRLNRKFAIQPGEVRIPTSAAAIQHGRHLVATRGCNDCHGADLAGRKVIDDPMAGVFWGANITRGQGGLPANYSDADYVRALRHGVAQDGRPLVLMPSHEYTEMTDEDLGAMIAYLKTVPSVDRERGPVKPGPLIRALLALKEVKLAAEEIDHAAPRVASITASVTPAYGKYLAASCIGCHGTNLSGGKIAGAPPDWPAAANLTPVAASTPRWTEEQFIQMIRSGQKPDGSKLNTVMPAAFGQMTDLELKALFSYIVTLPSAATGGR